MNWLNYHHLLYFWTVARTGTIAAASKQLHLSQPTISTQLKTLDEALGVQLFVKQGRRLVLTEMGRTVFRYADEIFRVGKELQETVSRGEVGGNTRFTVGVADVIPKLIAERLLQPAFEHVPHLRLQVHEGPLPQLLGQLALHELDVVLSDAPAGSDIKVRAFSHSLGESGTTFFAREDQAQALKRNFPHSLHQAPALLPSQSTSARRQLEQWFNKIEIQPSVVGEFDDSALAQTFGQRGFGFFVAPSVIEQQVVKQHEVAIVGRTDEIKDRFYAISVERRLRHPAVVAVAQSARSELFG